MPPIRTILHPTDFSSLADEALRIAQLIASKVGARLVLLHVEQLHQLDPSGAAVLSRDEGVLGQQRLDSRAARMGPVPSECFLVEGDPITEILRVSERIACDLIVIGSHGHGDRRQPLGRVATSVVNRCHCPFLTVLAPSSAASPRAQADGPSSALPSTVESSASIVE